MIALNEKQTVRFWGHVNKSVPSGCWLWTSAVNQSGYGAFCIVKGAHIAHRIAYTLANGPIPDGLYVLHKCDVKLCVNPEHLFIGTQDDNMKDRSAKGRAPIGEGNKLSKLKSEQVLEIRRLHASKELGPNAIASRFGVSPANVQYIVTRKTWKHI